MGEHLRCSPADAVAEFGTVAPALEAIPPTPTLAAPDATDPPSASLESSWPTEGSGAATDPATDGILDNDPSAAPPCDPLWDAPEGTRVTLAAGFPPDDGTLATWPDVVSVTSGWGEEPELTGGWSRDSRPAAAPRNSLWGVSPAPALAPASASGPSLWATGTTDAATGGSDSCDAGRASRGAPVLCATAAALRIIASLRFLSNMSRSRVTCSAGAPGGEAPTG